MSNHDSSCPPDCDSSHIPHGYEVGAGWSDLGVKPPDGPNCFVAHTFGNSSIVTRSLRVFRDKVLVKLPYGLTAANAYYRRLSPTLLRWSA